MLGLYPRPSPKFSKNFMTGAESLEAAIKGYVAAVKARRFPGPEHSY
jgi:3-methyl-2-oxobutanoate hydroxymethyltransferase